MIDCSDRFEKQCELLERAEIKPGKELSELGDYARKSICELYRYVRALEKAYRVQSNHIMLQAAAGRYLSNKIEKMYEEIVHLKAEKGIEHVEQSEFDSMPV